MEITVEDGTNALGKNKGVGIEKSC